MKNLYALLLGALALPAVGQYARPPLPAHPEERSGYHVPASKPTTGREKGACFYAENFDSGIGDWTIVNVTGDVPWVWTNTGPGPTTSTYPVPALSTTTGGWMMVDDDFLGESGVAAETQLISPVIDLSTSPANLKVEFDQYFQEWEQDHCFVGVSTDGGVTWTETEVNEGVGRDGRPNPELMDVNISDAVAVNPANVQLRFRYNGIWDYGWEVDNVCITELPNNDMALLTTNRTTFDATTGIGIPYTIYPQAHVQPMDMTVQHKNKGFLTQNGVVASISIEGPGGVEATNTASTIANVAPGVVTDAVFDTYTPSGDPGTYTVHYSLSQTQTDEAPADNTRDQSFLVTPGTYAVDGGVCTSFQRQAANRSDLSFEVGSLFEMVDADAAIAIEVAVHDNTPVGGTIYGAIYLPATVANTPPDLVDVTDDHTITASELNSVGGTTFITIPFANPVPLDGGFVYQVMAGEYDAVDSVNFATSGFIPSQISTIYYPNAADTFEFAITKAPMVRLKLLSGGVGIVENGRVVREASAMPNPFSDATDLRFTLENAASVRFELRDVTGRLLMAQDLGELGAGEQRHRIDGSALSDGAYTYSLLVDGVRRSGRLVHHTN